jgi:hypothetical protein
MTWQDWLGAFGLGLIAAAVIVIGVLLAIGWRY